MAYEIVKFTDDAGQAVQITPDDVRRTFCADATDREVQQFLALCATQRLNPWVRDAYLVKYGHGPASIITSRAAIQKRADANPNYDGCEIGVVVLTSSGAVEHRPGEACYKALGEQLIGGWARAYRKDRKPYYSEVPMAEYSTGKGNWAKMPGTMISKVAEMHALRGAFPADFQGMYSPEEMAQAQERPAPDAEVAPAAPSAQRYPQEDLDWLRACTELLGALGYRPEEVRAYLWQRYRSGGRVEADGAFRAMKAAVGQAGPVPEGQPEPPEAVEPDEFEDEDIDF